MEDRTGATRYASNVVDIVRHDRFLFLLDALQVRIEPAHRTSDRLSGSGRVDILPSLKGGDSYEGS
jgi:hypothetical protein